ncbi:hypothetical protein NFI95_15460 [Acetobacteraceae bacterium KSS8]|uniref:Uncharacterized protein n=1 Tax=Endosaccharibacter trunci TaxID=2812733 RepID=A0ABT1WCJ2_9PROT|nr:hypothetical protein [Acetobacteraceae bacterium KSS8]
MARSLERWIVNDHNEIVLEREPLANIPLVAHQPEPPAEMAAGRKLAAYKLLDLPLPTGIKPGVWTFNTQASPIYCDGIFGMFAWALGHHPEGAYDIPITIDPVLPATESNPPAAAIQKGSSK